MDHAAAQRSIDAVWRAESPKVVAALMKTPQPPLEARGFQITAGSAYLEQIAEMAGDTRLEALLSLFQLHADCGDGFFVPAGARHHYANMGGAPAVFVFGVAPDYRPATS